MSLGGPRIVLLTSFGAAFQFPVPSSDPLPQASTVTQTPSLKPDTVVSPRDDSSVSGGHVEGVPDLLKGSHATVEQCEASLSKVQKASAVDIKEAHEALTTDLESLAESIEVLSNRKSGVDERILASVVQPVYLSPVGGIGRGARCPAAKGF
jgi:hypothetical protein